jgi:hypothetical protein
MSNSGLKQAGSEKGNNFSSEIFISYAWKGKSEEYAEKLEKAFAEEGIPIVRDKQHLGYKGLIKQFMEQIGLGKCVLVIISDKYLKSSNCMFELVEIAKNGDFYDRIFPIVLEDANFYDAIDRLKYIRHWEQKIQELEEAMKQGGLTNLQGITDDLNLYHDIQAKIASLTDVLRNMNTLTPEMLEESGFQDIIQAVKERLQQDSTKDVTAVNQSQSQPPVKTSENLAPEAPSSNKTEILRTLKRLLPVQFDELIFNLDVPIEYLPSSDKSQADRAMALLRWAETPKGCGLGKIQQAVEEY